MASGFFRPLWGKSGVAERQIRPSLLFWGKSGMVERQIRPSGFEGCLTVVSCYDFVEAGVLVVPHQFVVDAQLPDLFAVDGTLFEVMSQQLEDGRLVVAVAHLWMVVLLKVLQCVFEVINGIVVCFDYCTLGAQSLVVMVVYPPPGFFSKQQSLLWCFEDMPCVGVELDVAVVACQRASSRNRIDHGRELMSFEFLICHVGAVTCGEELLAWLLCYSSLRNGLWVWVGDCKSPVRLRSDYKFARTGAEPSGKSSGAWGDFVIWGISF